MRENKKVRENITECCPSSTLLYKYRCVDQVRVYAYKVELNIYTISTRSRPMTIAVKFADVIILLFRTMNCKPTTYQCIQRS